MTAEITTLFIILAVLVVVFSTELIRIDLAAVLCMLALAWTGILTPAEAFSGFSGSAVISIMAVMILGYGIQQSGIMKRLAGPIVSSSGKNESRLLGLVSLTGGGISSFMPNIGVAALFLPVLRRISRETDIPASRLFMPMGFTVILGGTLTLVGSGPMILLNDLLNQSGLESYGLFASTPVGIFLLATGTLFFICFGKSLLPSRDHRKKSCRTQQHLMNTFNLDATVYMLSIPKQSLLVGKTREESGLWENYRLNLLAISDEGENDYAPWRMTRFQKGQNLALFGCKEDVDRFSKEYGLFECHRPQRFEMLRDPDCSGFAQLIVLPGSQVAGKTLREMALRKNSDVEPVMLLKGNDDIRGDFSDHPFEPGDIVVVYGLWEKIEKFKDNADFVLASDIEGKTPSQSVTLKTGLTLAGVLSAVLMGVSLPVSLMSGVAVLWLLKVISIDESYRAVNWRTVFLIAGLIPLGIAMEKTGAAALVSSHMMSLLEGSPVLVVMLAVAVLTTLFSLFMSSVAATVLLVPLVIGIARSMGMDPAPMALLVAICSANSFILPTHQVNAFLMAPGGYRTLDYVKTGGIMTVLFLLVSVSAVYLFYMV